MFKVFAEKKSCAFLNKEDEMGRACGTYVWKERCIQGFAEETWGKEITGKA
jgi:hypothetical protein